MVEKSNLLTAPQRPISRDIVKQIALDIGKEVAAHLETMYPDAVKATSKNMLLSLRNKVYNEIIAALEITDEAKILDRLDVRRAFRRKQKAFWKKHRETDWEKIRNAKDVLE